MHFDNYIRKLITLYEDSGVDLQLNAPASKEAVQALEKQSGFELPAGLRSAWLATNGIGDYTTVFARPGFLTGYDFLSITNALHEREGLQKRSSQYLEYIEPEPRNPKIQPGWYQNGWLPFAGFGGGSLLLMIDFSPASTGTSGQIISFTHDPDQIEFVSSSFEGFLTASLNAIGDDPEGFISC